MGVWNQIAEYLYLKKKDPNRPKDKWIGYMHGINRISLFIFILCLIILAIKLLYDRKFVMDSAAFAEAFPPWLNNFFNAA